MSRKDALCSCGHKRSEHQTCSSGPLDRCFVFIHTGAPRFCDCREYWAKPPSRGYRRATPVLAHVA